MAETEYSAGVLAVPVPDRLQRRIQQFSRVYIPRSALYIKQGENFGREPDSHITVLYGLQSDKAVKLRRVLDSVQPFFVRLGRVSLFRQDDYDVVKIEVSGPELRQLHGQTLRRMSVLPQQYSYSPHITVAYVRKGEADSLSGMKTFNGESFKADQLLFRSQAGRRELISLHDGLSKQAEETEQKDGGWLQVPGNFLEGYGKFIGGLSGRASGVLPERFKQGLTTGMMESPTGQKLLAKTWNTIRNDPTARTHLMSQYAASMKPEQLKKLWQGLKPAQQQQMAKTLISSPEMWSAGAGLLQKWIRDHKGLAAAAVGIPALFLLGRHLMRGRTPDYPQARYPAQRPVNRLQRFL